MHLLLLAVLAFQPATVIVLQYNNTVMLAVQLGDTVYTAEFSRRDLKPDAVKDGDHVQADVKNRNLIIRLRNGQRVSARIIQVQRTIVHPLP